MSQTIFLSTTSGEFGTVRRRLAAVCGRTKRLHVRHQEDFVQHGVLTLHMLEKEVRASDLVVHLVGADFGAVPPREQVDDLLGRRTDFETRFPEVAEAARRGDVSYTQWEAWLSLYFRSGSEMRFCAYETVESREKRHPLQAAHLERLRKREVYPKIVPAGGDLGDEVLLSLVELGFLTKEESRTIVHLPYPSIGTLFKGARRFWRS